MTDGGESERLAPVIPLFGGAALVPDATGDEVGSAAADEPVAGDAGQWRSTWHGTEPNPGTPGRRHPANGAPARPAPKLKALRPHSAPEDAAETIGADSLRTAAEEVLVRKLRTRSLSISEARTVLKGYALQEQRLEAAQVDDVIDDFCRRGYLDDAILAGHLVTSGVERKGQGRVALARALAQRGIPRDVIDAALGELPDDDARRALEFARTKARSLARLDGDTALRRLVGQLARRGYNGAVAMAAAKTALAESTGASATGVRFVDSD